LVNMCDAEADRGERVAHLRALQGSTKGGETDSRKKVGSSAHIGLSQVDQRLTSTRDPSVHGAYGLTPYSPSRRPPPPREPLGRWGLIAGGAPHERRGGLPRARARTRGWSPRDGVPVVGQLVLREQVSAVASRR
jgi:hypothetical protein